MAEKVTYRLIIKDTYGRNTRPSWTTDTDNDPGQRWVENFFGCHEPDVESFEIKRVVGD